MMTKPPFDDDKTGTAGEAGPSVLSSGSDPSGFGGWTRQGGPALHPLMQNPTASVAAAAAVGFGIASHFAGFMLGAMQGFMEAAQKSAAAVEPERSASEPPAASTEKTEAREPEAEPVIAPTVPEPAVPEPTVPEPVADVVETAAAVAPKAVRAKRVPNTSTADKVARPRRTKSNDDLKRISGVGPKLEQVLKSMDVTRFAQIAAWDEAEIARFDEALGVSGRIARDRWVEQAKALMKA